MNFKLLRKLVFLKAMRTPVRWARGVGRPQVVDIRCRSVRAGKSVSLPGQFLRSADEVQVSFTVRWPVLVPKSARSLTVKLTAPDTAGKKEIESAGLVAEKIRADDLPGLTQESDGGATRAQVRINGRLAAGTKRIELEVRRRDRPKLLRRIALRLLEPEQAQQLRLQKLRATSHQLRVFSGDCWQTTCQVADSSDFISAEFTIVETSLGSVLPPVERSIALVIYSGNRALYREDCRVTLNGQPVKIKGRPLGLRGHDIFEGPGSYRVVASIEGRILSSFPFRIVSAREWEQQVKVTLFVDAESGRGGPTRQKGALTWGKHNAFRPSIKLETTIPAPHNLLKCSLDICLGNAVLQCDTFELRLYQERQQVWFRAFHLRNLGLRMQERRVRLNLVVRVGDEVRAEAPVIILPGNRVANFEGQLTLDPRTECIDEEAYEEIISNLIKKAS
jgi:hypothetical protein